MHNAHPVDAAARALLAVTAGMFLGAAAADNLPASPSSWPAFVWFLAPALYAAIQAFAEWLRAKARARKVRKHGSP
jgi:hypothetical protein